jgi:hypothetical protein
MCQDALNYQLHGDLCAQVNSKGEEDWTALHMAASHNCLEVCEMLIHISEEIDLHALTSSGQTALHLAAERGFLEVVQLLVTTGSQVNARDYSGRTALHLAAMMGQSDTVLWLLSKHADPTLINREGKTAYQEANREVATLLERYFTERNLPFQPCPLSSAGPSQAPANVIITYDHSAPEAESFPAVEYTDFVPKCLLGKGGFAEVYLVEQQSTGKEYAMKVLSKEKIVERSLERYVLTERNVLSYIKHPFIVNLNYAFQTPEEMNYIARTQSFCGSIGYLAPEMLRKEGHNQTVGYYLLGVLLYEMLVGKLPFYDFDVAIMLSKIVRTPVKVPSSVSTQATQLLTRLLDKDPSTRLGAGGTNEIKAHPFFQEIDWEAAYQRKLRPPPITHTRRVKTEGLSLEKVYGLALEGDYEGKVPGWSFVQGRPHS